MDSTIGMAAFFSLTAFSFYLPDYQPLGMLRKFGLYSPEMMLGTAPFLPGLLNGCTSLVRTCLRGERKGLEIGCMAATRYRV